MTPNRVRVYKSPFGSGPWCCTQSDTVDWYTGANEDAWFDTWEEAYAEALTWAGLA